MNEPLREFEGTWEEVAAQSCRWTGHRVRLTLLDIEKEAKEKEANDIVMIPQRPEPTPEQAKLGIMPAAIGNGTGADIMRLVQTLHSDALANDGEELWEAIAENRAMRRQLAEERE